MTHDMPAQIAISLNYFILAGSNAEEMAGL